MQHSRQLCENCTKLHTVHVIAAAAATVTWLKQQPPPHPPARPLSNAHEIWIQIELKHHKRPSRSATATAVPPPSLSLSLTLCLSHLAAWPTL